MSINSSEAKPAYLYLQDGTLLVGQSFGATGTIGGELCFTTGMTGYQEVFTDPSFSGQVLIMNNVYVGNYGVKADEIESDSVKIRALVARNFENRYSRMQAEGSLGEYFVNNNIIAISGIDTRALVAHIRSKGAMNAIVSTEYSDKENLQKALDKIPSMEGLNLSEEVATKEPYTFGNPEAKYKIAVYDFGIKRHILQNLSERNLFIKVFPGTASFEETQNFQPDAYFISNGPGDPASIPDAVENIKKILDKNIPVFGICLGHQLLALSQGLKTMKMHHGHRGTNHPVKNLLTGSCEITTQNHGFVVDGNSINDNVEVTHLNLNDGSIEGIRLKNKPAFSVQYHPESTPGPHDSRYLFDQFLQLIENKS